MIRSIFRVLLIWFGICMVVGFVKSARNPQRGQIKNTNAKQPAAQKAETEQDIAGRNIMARAYAVGKSLSMAGTVKPTNAEVDAMSRRMQTQMGDRHSPMWFKQYFEAGFWEGWKRR